LVVTGGLIDMGGWVWATAGAAQNPATTQIARNADFDAPSTPISPGHSPHLTPRTSAAV
jgi:hypothetical protein